MAALEGSMFYWICWFFWIYLTFILHKNNPYRLKLSAAVLILIILAGEHFTFMGLNIYLGGLFLLLLSYSTLYGEKSRRVAYFFICSLIVSIATVTFHLFTLLDPVWIVFHQNWVIGVGISYIAILLQKTPKGRFTVMISGTMQGEFLYGYILKNYHFPYEIGSLPYLDACALTMLLLVCWSSLENAAAYFEQHFNIHQKGKQKSS